MKRLGLAFIALALLVPAGATGATGANPEDRAREIERELGELSGAEADALTQLEAVRAQRLELDTRVLTLNSDVAAAERALGEISDRLEVATARYLWYDRKLSEAKARVRHARASFTDAAVALYTSGTGESDLLVFEGDDPLSAGAGQTYLEEVGHQRREAVMRFDRERAKLEELTAESEDERAAVEHERAEADAQRERIDDLRDAQQRLLDDAALAEQQEASLLLSLRERAAVFEAELATLRASSSAITDMLRQRQSGQPLATSFTVIMPVDGEVGSPFGQRLHPILGTYRLHAGVDIDAPQGAPIWAAATGVVAWAGPRSGYGNTVIIDHGNQYATLYAHMSQISVRAGDAVAAGDVVGAVGATGLATGPHLHFEVRLLGVPVDPQLHL